MRPVFFLSFCGQIMVPPSCRLTCMRPRGAARQSAISSGPFKVTVHFLLRVVQVLGWLPRVVKGRVTDLLHKVLSALLSPSGNIPMVEDCLHLPLVLAVDDNWW